MNESKNSSWILYRYKSDPRFLIGVSLNQCMKEPEMSTALEIFRKTSFQAALKRIPGWAVLVNDTSPIVQCPTITTMTGAMDWPKKMQGQKMGGTRIICLALSRNTLVTRGTFNHDRTWSRSTFSAAIGPIVQVAEGSQSKLRNSILDTARSRSEVSCVTGIGPDSAYLNFDSCLPPKKAYPMAL